MESVREPAVAGSFYPKDPRQLSELVQSFFSEESFDCPKAIIAPHAGYIYSGPTAGKVYERLQGARDRINRVILLGPSHRVAFKGIAAPTSTSFRTPLGDIPVDTATIQKVISLPAVGFLEQAHTEEHSLEVHLPFLQTALGDFTLVPLVVGDASKEEVAAVLETCWGDDETVIVISSDLSHYEPYEEATKIDRHTCTKIIALESNINGKEACGCRPVNGLLHFLKNHDLGIELVDLRNSGDTAGDRSRVVGYGAWQVLERFRQMWSTAHRQRLLQVAREAIRSPLEGEKQFHIDLKRFPEPFREDAACFVTINLNGQLRGCIGSLTAHRPLVLDVAENAQAAAFRDPRFRQLSYDEYQDIDVHISILSKPIEVVVDSREALIEKLKPGVHGLILKDGSHQATYLPSVWDQIPDAETFVSELRRKAGLPADGWSDSMQVFFYTTEEFS